MRQTEPQVFIISEPSLDWGEVFKYLQAVNGVEWYENRLDERVDGERDSESLVEFMGKMCYRSWSPGLNPNVKRVRDDQKVYIENILKSKHGSVLEHAYFSFIFYGVSRVFTHELVRHRAGVAISQESMRFVRLDDIPFWMPEWARGDEELQEQAKELLWSMENFQTWAAIHFGLDAEDKACPTCKGVGALTEVTCKRCDGKGGWCLHGHVKHVVDCGTYTQCPDCKGLGGVPDPSGITNICPECTGRKRLPVSFHEKKEKTSFMRRFAPDGVATSIGWTANVRTLRHVIEARTAEGAEEEIRLVFDLVAQRMVDEHPLFFGDFERSDDGTWTPTLGSKV